mgnify:CR=1 FL=1|jgi:hypothetical protein|tara:strand:- start:71 stop:373 length:303 start_codon:yes stop_codon:yes gene_type:complete
MATKTEKQEVIEYLKAKLKDEDTIYTNLKHVSQSGMTRDIQLLFIKDNKPLNLNYYVSKALGNRIVNNGVRIGGCGMDMGFALVYNLSRILDIKLHHSWI